MTTKTTATMTTDNYFYGLPVELQRLIYDYDPTYRNKYEEVNMDITMWSHLITERKIMAISDHPITKRQRKKIIKTFAEYAPKDLPKDKLLTKWDYYQENWWIEYVSDDRIFAVSLDNWPFPNVVNLVNECEIIPDEDIYILEKKEVIEMINERIREEDEMYGIPDGMEAWEGGDRIQALHYYILEN